MLAIDHLHNSTKVTKELQYYLAGDTETVFKSTISKNKQIFNMTQQVFLISNKKNQLLYLDSYLVTAWIPTPVSAFPHNEDTRNCPKYLHLTLSFLTEIRLYVTKYVSKFMYIYKYSNTSLTYSISFISDI